MLFRSTRVRVELRVGAGRNAIGARRQRARKGVCVKVIGGIIFHVFLHRYTSAA